MPIEQLDAWAKLNGVEFHNCQVKQIVTQDGQDRGAGIIATGNRHGYDDDILMYVPAELVLSQYQVEQFATCDKYLKDILEAVGDFGRVGASREMVVETPHELIAADRQGRNPDISFATNHTF